MPTLQNAVELPAEVLNYWASYALAQQVAHDAIAAYVH